MTTGESNENAERIVPTTADTVTAEYEVVTVVAALSVHATVVADDHDVVAHARPKAAFAVAVNPYEPKFSPVVVTIVPPDFTPFDRPSQLPTGAAHKGHRLFLHYSLRNSFALRLSGACRVLVAAHLISNEGIARATAT